MNTNHRIFFEAAKYMHQLKDASVDLVVTSPPYPMISMWDSIVPVNENNPYETFEKWHCLLDEIWSECIRVTKEGGFICINIGDATRTINKKFAIYPNHSRITNFFLNHPLITVLPSIIWWKPTNAPSKFMGSGMLPGGAYVTLEHEHILIFRKGNKTEFKSTEDKIRRRQSAFFWEERNVWFSDTWNLQGVPQRIKTFYPNRERSAAFPIELPLRLINMYSLISDVVLDPFVGTGTTTMAAIALGRNSVGYEIDASFKQLIYQKIWDNVDAMRRINPARIERHLEFVKAKNKPLKHFNKFYNFPVVTAQEVDLALPDMMGVSLLSNIVKSNNVYKIISDSIQIEGIYR